MDDKTLLARLASGQVRAALTLAGQGSPVLPSLTAQIDRRPELRPRLEAAARRLDELVGSPAGQASGRFRLGYDLPGWCDDLEARPPDSYLRSAAVSFPLVLLTQLLAWEDLWLAGFDQVMAAGSTGSPGSVVGVTGHSQGLLGAVALAEAPLGPLDDERLARYLEVAFQLGLHVSATASSSTQIGSGPENGAAPTPMVAVTGVRLSVLAEVVEEVNSSLAAPERVTVALVNAPDNLVLSGPPASLALVHAQLADGEVDAASAPGAGRNAGRAVGWSPLAIDVPFHSPALREPLAGFLAGLIQTEQLPEPGGLALPVLSCSDPERDLRRLPDRHALAEVVARDLVLAPVRWDAAVAALVQAGANWVIDLGPGTDVSRLTAGNLQGRGPRALPLGSPEGMRILTTPGAAPTDPDLRYADLAPTLVELVADDEHEGRPAAGRLHLDNRYVRVTGQPPVILPGMTPTTADVPIVAAAANAGYTAELAGGGQPTARIMRARMAELTERVDPDVGVVFNTLYLDRRRWQLHVGDPVGSGLVFEAKRAGAPLVGLTVSAGVPDVDEAVRLLDALAAEGMVHNAFKPGTVEQIRQVVAIAQAVPRRPVFVHVEGGKAGGHHSYEDLEALLLAGYHELRRAGNVVLCAGGGVGTPERAASLLSGRWSLTHGQPAMPVDAVLVGTAAMACAEAAASPQVKQLLADTPGTGDWVPRRGSAGGVYSGLSSLGADIHTVDNAAARAADLLSEVAGDADAVAARRAEIVAALAKTAKPHFGEVAEMTYAGVLRRFTDLCAIGPAGPYEDGAWLDPSWRAAALALYRRWAARLDARDEGRFRPPVAAPADLDDPSAALARFVATYPAAEQTVLHPADAVAFVDVCATGIDAGDLAGQPMKPVPFVPVLDADVRRWFMADALWQAQDPRYDADGVFVIPGPESVAGITRTDEPVADLLARFVTGIAAALSPDPTAAPVDATARAAERDVSGGHRGGAVGEGGGVFSVGRPDSVLPEGSAAGAGSTASVSVGRRDRLRVRGLTPEPLASAAEDRSGPLAALCVQPLVHGGRNPLWALVHPGDELQVDVDETGRLRRLEARPRGGHGGERLVAALDDGGVALSALLPALDPTGEVSVPLTDVFHPSAFGPSNPAADPAGGDVEPPGGGCTAGWVSEADKVVAYRAVTGATHHGVPVDWAFSLAWPALTAWMAEVDRRWRTNGGDVRPRPLPFVTAERAHHRSAVTDAHLPGPDGGMLAKLVHHRHRVTLGEAWPPLAGESGTATARPLDWSSDRAGLHLDVEVELRSDRGWLATVHAGLLLRGATGGGGPLVAEVGRGSGGSSGTSTLARARVELGEAEDWAPEEMAAFARVGGDRNPLHRSVLAARLAGLDAPIVHGMWTAARAEAFLVDRACEGQAERLRDWSVQFTAPVRLGAELRFEAARVGAEDGGAWIEVVVSQDDAVVALGRGLVAPPRTGVVFPGQGIQRRGLGGASRDRSRAARQVWQRVDAHAREALGLPLLDVVERNPVELGVAGGVLRHPHGVLHRTEITQPTLVALAAAQLAELREDGALPADLVAAHMVVAGHSVGELSALVALEVLSVETGVELAYRRGLEMQAVVPRDAAGESPFRLAAVDPSRARLDLPRLEALVEEVADSTGELAEVVNHNSAGRQYVLAGTRVSLAELELRLGGSLRLLEGIDVPFHSSVLQPAVDRFRTHLQAAIGRVDHRRLVGHWVPNLLGRPFALDEEPGGEDLDAVARRLLIDILARHVAEPVRWIDVQRCLAEPCRWGGLGVHRQIEVGPAHATVLSDLAPATLATARGTVDGVELLHAERDRARVLLDDPPPDDQPSAEKEAPVAEPADDPSRISSGDKPVRDGTRARPRNGEDGAAVVDRAVGAAEAVRWLLAVQAHVRPDQLRDDETMEELFAGASSRRNQVLVDLGRELGLAEADGLHELPLGRAVEDLATRAGRYRFPGGYLRDTITAGLTRAVGPAGLTRRDVVDHLAAAWSLSAGWVERALVTLVVETRPGESARGGALGRLVDPPARDPASGRALLDRAVELLGTEHGVDLRPPPSKNTSGGAYSSSTTNTRLQKPPGADEPPVAGDLVDLAEAGEDDPVARLELLDREHGEGRAAAVRPKFDHRRHVCFASSWASARWDLVALYHDALAQRRSFADLQAEADRLARHGDDPVLAASVGWFAAKARSAERDDVAHLIERVVPGQRGDALDFAGQVALVTGASPGSIAASLVAELLQGGAQVVVATSTTTSERRRWYRDLYRRSAAPGAELHVVPANLASFADIDALIDWLGSGGDSASRGSDLNRSAAYGAAPDDWGASNGPPARPPSLVAPFAAMAAVGDAADAGSSCEVAVRIQLLGVERLVASLARLSGARGLPDPVTVLLPLSPNHGDFGGDGSYGETKAALEVLARRRHAELASWGRHARIVAARIGWVRGTGLMGRNDDLAPLAEEHLGIRTFSAPEMARLLAEACAADPAYDQDLDLTGGLADLDLPSVGLAGLANLAGPPSSQPVVYSGHESNDRDSAAGWPLIEAGESSRSGVGRRLGPGAASKQPVGAGERAGPGSTLAEAAHVNDRAANGEPAAVLPDGAEQPDLTVAALPSLREAQAVAETADDEATGRLNEPRIDPAEMVVIVGAGELGPCGTALSRFAMELGDPLPAGVVVELAWLCGLVGFERSGTRGEWVDTTTGEPVPEAELADRYRAAVAERSGIRTLEDDGVIDPSGASVLAPVQLDRDVTFEVGSEDEARSYLASDPAHTEVRRDPTSGALRVTRRAGALVRMPRRRPHTRRVAGQLPRGLHLAGFGVPGDLLVTADRLALVNLACTAEAFRHAGLEPAELLERVHPAAVVNTQGAGMGGMFSVRHLFLDQLLDRERQSDRLQEALGNVMAAHVVQAYVGSYGAMLHPVAACATAAVSLEAAWDQIRAGKALAVVAGGYDDLTPEGMAGFGDMQATVSSEQLEAMGLEPAEASRPNDVRRGGFVEAQGGGAFLVVRGDVALDLGLPVRGVLAYAGSFGDGIQTSIPAPGRGLLAAGRGGPDSPLAAALRAHGLGVDDIGVVSKHDTSTLLNDPNEADLHQRLQTALGRTPGNPLLVVSQKAVTGHAKGGAAAWQVAGVLQMLETGRIPGNRNLDTVDPRLRADHHLVHGDRPISCAPGEPPLAALVTSLGFGHVSGLLAVAHPDVFLAGLPGDTRRDYLVRADERRSRGERARLAVRHGDPPPLRRAKPWPSDGANADAEAAMLLSPDPQ